MEPLGEVTKRQVEPCEFLERSFQELFGPDSEEELDMCGEVSRRRQLEFEIKRTKKNSSYEELLLNFNRQSVRERR